MKTSIFLMVFVSLLWSVSSNTYAQCHLRLVGDVNGDTLADIVGFGANQVSVALGNRDGRFAAPIDVFSNFSNADGWRVGEHLRYLADVNGDRRVDIVGFGENQVSVALGRTDGRFDPPINSFNRFTNADGWRVSEHLRYLADVNGDRRADIVGFGENQVSVALGRTDGRFDPPIDVFSHFTGAEGWRIGEHLRELADVNGDRRADIVGFGADRVWVALGEREGRFASPIEVFSRFSNADGWQVGRHLRLLADVNGDTLADIVGFGANRVSVALGRRDGRFGTPIDVFNHFTNAEGWSIGEYPRHLADVNGDNRADIVGFGANRVSVALGQRDGRFATPIDVFANFTNADGWRVGEHLRFVMDLNNDRRADIIGFGAERVATALGQADGRFGTSNGVLSHFTAVNGGWATCREQQDQNIARIIATSSVVVTPPSTGLIGWVDMHTHPMSHLGFGKKLMHGVPDVGSIIPAGTRNCNPSDFRANTIEEALGNCNSTHGGWGTDNSCGNYIRAIAVSKAFDGDFFYNVDHNPFAEGNLHWDHKHEGIETSPNFTYWPHQTSVTHQQMWWEWIKRAYDGGLRVMVALSVNNELMAEVIDADPPKDDMASSDLQIDEIISFVGRHNDFMEIARSATDLRRIVNANKLAVIVGIEVDNIGNFNRSGVICNEATVRGEIRRLYDKGVRYIFPIHVVDNKFGGTAVYEDLFNFANKYVTGNLFTVERTPDASVSFRLGSGLDHIGNLGIKTALDVSSGIPYPPALNIDPFDSRFCPSATLGCWEKFRLISGILAPDLRYITYAGIPGGHVNSKGLTPLGEFAIKEMMKLGMLIDIDHMSQKSVNRTLSIAESFDYPVNSGHNGVRPTEGGTERALSADQYRRIARLGGMAGLGTADIDPSTFIVNYSSLRLTMGKAAIGIGTDVNGFEKLPRSLVADELIDGVLEKKSNVLYSSSFPMCQTGNRTWDYNKEGVAHYGLLPDFLQDVRNRLGTNTAIYFEDGLFRSAEYFAQMWEKCERRKSAVR